jgi:FMN reductase (NADPH)
MEKTETIRVLESHVSIRQYRPEPVPDDLLMTVIRAACRAPTSSGIQAYSLIVIRDPERRRLLSVLAGNQAHVAETPVLLAVCADLSRARRACELHKVPFAGENMEIGMVAVVDAALAGMSLMLAAESAGLGCVMIGGMRNKPVEVARLLNLPAGAFVVFGMCLGWPLERPVLRPRLPEDAAVHFEQYELSKTDMVLNEYDRLLAQQSGGTLTWTARIARDFSTPRRANLRSDLAALGLPFE